MGQRSNSAKFLPAPHSAVAGAQAGVLQTDRHARSHTHTDMHTHTCDKEKRNTKNVVHGQEGICLVSSRRDIVTWHGSGCGRMGTQLMLPPRHLIQGHPHRLLFHGNSCLCWFSISVTERRKPSASTRDRFVLTGGSGVLVQRFSACVPRPLSQESRIRYPAYRMFPLQFTTVQSDSYEAATK